MGLFDMFGVGGGRVAIQPQSQHVTAGGALAGVIGFQGGSRAQQVTKVTVKLVMEQAQTQMTQQGPRPTTSTREVVPAQTVTGPFTTTPGQVQQFAFNLQIPGGLPNTTPGQMKYRLVASADIDGEIDPGANVEIQVVGGTPVMASMPGQTMPPVPQIGMQVMAQWQDGNWHPAQIVAMQNGMIGVDWVNAALGQSSWVHPQQIQAQTGMPQMHAKPHSNNQQHDPHPMKKGVDVHPSKVGVDKHAPVAIGTHVFAQWQDGHWHPARVVAMQNGVYGIDWDDPKLGQSSWVQPHQVRAK
ncbi:sporulation protein [Sandaracinus amylolyticus]|uniref:sporulation protein n=1 Tax=Sandaracinus amylolyticus TaxID=927083 RepID=UPI001F1CD498|nr:sporulation protein [Sandaracinus amylolyticus]UJR86924.1 Hypothetical protein I5071_90250 [Sandaracinus amylolyticus]